ncbi:uncharacterized protein MEPE_02654 [Melanopsichium pennsylvanicum]|uniref:Uncharacterized protein n=1 Tax=Melanopsichium pennsylvanicum TaxID=63383 RepID=A0AAJ4XL37_9BASI|nr:uncharacterized protein MEPE_02654 [Melanopsichium pennsylvanicum]
MSNRNGTGIPNLEANRRVRAVSMTKGISPKTKKKKRGSQRLIGDQSIFIAIESYAKYSESLTKTFETFKSSKVGQRNDISIQVEQPFDAA